MSARNRSVPCDVLADDAGEWSAEHDRKGKTYRLTTQLRAGLPNIHELTCLIRVVVCGDCLIAPTALSRRAADIVDGCSGHLLQPKST